MLPTPDLLDVSQFGKIHTTKIHTNKKYQCMKKLISLMIECV